MKIDIRNTEESSMWKFGAIWASAFQRCGHYGIRSLLIIYLTAQMHLSFQEAGQVYGLFYGSLFFTSLLGGLLGDSRLGFSRAGSIGLILIFVGSVGLALQTPIATLFSLAVYSIGFGLFDPNLNLSISRKFPESEQLRSAAYTVLYTAINIGAMVGPFLFGYVALQFGVKFAFPLAGLLALIGCPLFRKATREGAFPKARGRDNETRKHDAQESPGNEHGASVSWPLISLSILAVIGIVFWAVFDQLGSSVTLLANEHVQRKFGSFVIPAGFVQSINPTFVILLGAPFSLVIKRRKRTLGEVEGGVRILSTGILLLGLGFGLLALATRGGSQFIGWGWIVLPILCATVGELLFAPASLSLTASLSPPGRQAFILGAWSATYGLGAYLSGTMAGAMAAFGAFSMFFGISAAACAVIGVVLWLAASKLAAVGSEAKVFPSS
jgi:POT family proton-dependent oligopeptide transporter